MKKKKWYYVAVESAGHRLRLISYVDTISGESYCCFNEKPVPFTKQIAQEYAEDFNAHGLSAFVLESDFELEQNF